ncbi:MAG: hypothetical protein V4565_09030 [Bacteroidota bacterium]
MTAIEFKNKLKDIKENLRGLTIQFVTEYSVRPYTCLQAFGMAVLDQENRGNDFRIDRVWTNEGNIPVNSFEQLVDLFNSKKIKCVTFEAFYQPKDIAQLMRNGFTLND